MLSTNKHPIDTFISFKDNLRSDPNLQSENAKAIIESYARAVIAITPFNYKLSYNETHGISNKTLSEVADQRKLVYLGFLRVPTLPNAVEKKFETTFGRKMDESKTIVIRVPTQNDFSEPDKKLAGAGAVLAIFELSE